MQQTISTKGTHLGILLVPSIICTGAHTSQVLTLAKISRLLVDWQVQAFLEVKKPEDKFSLDKG